MPRNIYDWFFNHTHLKMAWIPHQIQKKDGYSNYPPPVLPSYPSPFPGSLRNESMSSSSPPSGGSSRNSPAVLFIIVILALLFFVSGLLHLLVRFLAKHPSAGPSAQSNGHQDISNSDTLQRQLQQLFHLHDSGLDQAYIDALPVFQYREIVGLKEPFDCAVCLSEFSENDKLRLLPTCSHAFHIDCIDTWLLSNSTCPLCRGTLFSPGFSVENPMFYFDDPREEDGCPCNGASGVTARQKTVEVEEIVEKAVLPVRLGKFRRLDMDAGDNAGGETSSSNLDARRCFSMGSYQYVLGHSDLRITLNDDRKLSHGTEETDKLSMEGDKEAKKITSVGKGESYSVSKIWLWSNKGKFSSSSSDQMGMPSPLNTDLPWMRTTEGT
ncbi:RING-H2 finger protein ATL46-like [Neltuma alba]|uniref:RING-H2 finger protein ATL46-like n=1 Tax=Neltuma alba TaxID=207710 RepID=UPI0010A42B29|nr:RING-H2 finger protein ATL46-like [Prosopis alba]XP_028778633.1 RING-H2 finger protein ATL46-like [Prosopis alba]XP_028793179.1 RING-H2 finger protein ATL46-like [Prosopis alba]